MEKRDYYEVLGVKKNDSEAEIKRQYKKLAKMFHPDKQTDEKKAKENEEKFKEINEAYEVLSNKEKRRNYDQFGHNMPRNGSNEPGYDDLRDFIRRAHESFFEFDQQQGTQHPSKPAPIRINLNLSIKEIYNGVDKKMKYGVRAVCNHCNGLKYNQADGGYEAICETCHGRGSIMNNQGGNVVMITPCQSCGGTGHKIINGCKVCNGKGYVQSEKIVELNIPKGAPNGGYITINGKGNEMYIKDEKVNGDLIVVINELPDKDFIREGNDLHRILEVPIIDSILGEEVTVDTIDNKKRKFKLKVGTESGERFRLAGLGMPIINTNNFGDFYIHIKHKMPKTLSEKEIELLNELKNHKNGK
jgi:molecular chaperone DnaJ